MQRRYLSSFLVAALSLTACKKGDDAAQSTPAAAPNASAAADPAAGDPGSTNFAPSLGIDLAKFTRRPSGLFVLDVAPGTGPEATAGKTVKVHYTGWTADGHQFETSRSGDPIEFPLGQSAVIAGWDEGIAGMKVGGKRRLVIPSAMAYGTAGSGPDIPPNSVLIFDVELVSAS